MSSETPSFYLLDSNILLRLSEANSPMHATAKQAVGTLISSGAVLFITGQNLIEFWNVATRPAERNGLGLTTAEVIAEISKYKAIFRFLPDAPDIFIRWELLVATYEVQGQKAHDARLAAVALSYEVPYLLTFNTKDFKRFLVEGVHAVDPSTIPLPNPQPS